VVIFTVNLLGQLQIYGINNGYSKQPKSQTVTLICQVTNKLPDYKFNINLKTALKYC